MEKEENDITSVNVMYFVLFYILILSQCLPGPTWRYEIVNLRFRQEAKLQTAKCQCFSVLVDRNISAFPLYK